MAANENLTRVQDIQVKPREIEFVTRFQRNWEALRKIMGIMRPIRKQPGVVLKTKTASIEELKGGAVAEGDLIPRSRAKVIETPFQEMEIQKYAKEVSIEAIKEHGYDTAVALTDEAFLIELQMQKVLKPFYEFLNTGTLTGTATSWKAALALAQGEVLNKFETMYRNVTRLVGFANIMDVYTYLSTADITVQKEFGLNYVKNFMGYDTLFLLGDNEIKRGRLIVTPSENIVNYYVDPGTSDFARADGRYVTAGQTPLIGFHSRWDYDRATSVEYAIMGLLLFAEYLDGIAVYDVEDTLGD